MPTTRKRIGERFRISRSEAGYDQSDVAHALGLSRQAVSAWERGARMPSATQLGDLSVLLGKPADYLLFGVETIPVAMLSGRGPSPMQHLSKMKEGFRGLVQAWVRDRDDQRVSDGSRL